jgi:hypothetical protein
VACLKYFAVYCVPNTPTKDLLKADNERVFFIFWHNSWHCYIKRINMKKFILAFLFTASAVFAYTQTIAYTQEGKRIVLFPNGSWYYADSIYGGGGGYQNTNQSASDMYTEAYEYAFEILYGDEFFRNDRETKSAAWAADYLKQNIEIRIGTIGLSQWYDELYQVAYNSVYKSVFFASERKQNAINWAKGLIEQKAVYDWSYQRSRIARTREAYQVAYNKIFTTEFFGNDRKRKASEWAVQFMRNRR